MRTSQSTRKVTRTETVMSVEVSMEDIQTWVLKTAQVGLSEPRLEGFSFEIRPYQNRYATFLVLRWPVGKDSVETDG